jgi:hypothetical protein
VTLIDPAAFQGAGDNTYTAARLRRVVESLAADREGIILAADLAVTADSPASLRVVVAAGRALVRGDAVTRQGVYLVENDAALFSPFCGAAHATLPRIDLLVLEVLDSAPDGGSAGADLPQLRIVAGTANASPVAPALPASAIALAELRVNAASTTVTTITDRRGLPVSSQAPATPIAPTWTALTLANGWTATAGFEVPSYSKDAHGIVRLRGVSTRGTADTIATLPAGYRPAAREVFNVWRQDVDAHAEIEVASTGVVSSTSGGQLSLSGIAIQAT